MRRMRCVHSKHRFCSDSLFLLSFQVDRDNWLCVHSSDVWRMDPQSLAKPEIFCKMQVSAPATIPRTEPPRKRLRRTEMLRGFIAKYPLATRTILAFAQWHAEVLRRKAKQHFLQTGWEIPHDPGLRLFKKSAKHWPDVAVDEKKRYIWFIWFCQKQKKSKTCKHLMSY